LRELMDRVFRTGKQVEEMLQVPCVALVPLQEADSSPGRIRFNWKTRIVDEDTGADSIGSRSITWGPSVLAAVLKAPLSRFGEAIRSIKFAADLNGARNTGRIIGMTSALPNEGKSTISVAFAQVVAQAGRRVIVVDCDLRNPSLSRTLAPGATIGILEVLSGESALSEALWEDTVSKIAFLPAIANTDLVDTAEILASGSAERLFGELRQTYDCVVVDLPPVVPVLDARVTTHLVDCYFWVVEWGRTNIDIVRRGLDTASGVCDKLAGVVLNKAKMDYVSRYDSYYSSEYYSKYFMGDKG